MEPLLKQFCGNLRLWNRCFDCLIVRSIVCLIDWLFEWLFEWLIDWLFDWNVIFRASALLHSSISFALFSQATIASIREGLTKGEIVIPGLGPPRPSNSRRIPVQQIFLSASATPAHPMRGSGPTASFRDIIRPSTGPHSPHTPTPAFATGLAAGPSASTTQDNSVVFVYSTIDIKAALAKVIGFFHRLLSATSRDRFPEHYPIARQLLQQFVVSA